MHVRILGSAAGGGFPQWNCACPNCQAARNRSDSVKPRSQAQVAVSADGNHWFLLGASPDLRSQIEGCPDLHPRSQRGSPVAGVILAGADLDHTLGLLLLRELHPLNVYATPSVATILRGNSMFGMLNRVPEQVNWLPITPGKIFSVQPPGESVPCFSCEPISISNRYPAYVRGNSDSMLVENEAALGLIIRENGKSGPRSLAYFPNVPHISDQLLATLSSVDLLMFDGTFWSDDELQRLQPGAETARQMGHLPVAGPSGSLEILSQIKVPRIYIHINNTNPMLNEHSREYRQIREAGWQLAEDGWQAQL